MKWQKIIQDPFKKCFYNSVAVFPVRAYKKNHPFVGKIIL